MVLSASEELSSIAQLKTGRMQKHRSIALMSFIFLLLLSFHSKAAVKEPVRLQLQYFHQFQFAGYYAAEFLGLYDKAGIDVSIIEGEPAINPVDRVVNGKVEFASSDTDLLWRRLQGAPIVALSAIFQNSGFCLVSLNTSGIMTLKDLRGRRVGIAGGRGRRMFDAMFKINGLDESSFTRIQPKWNLQSLIDGETDANGAYVTGELYRLRELGLGFNVIYPQDYGVDFYGDTLFTNEQFLRSHPELVEKFRQASLEGWRYAFEHTEETIDYILHFPSVKERQISRERLRYEAATMRHLILPDLIEIGTMSLPRWQKMAEMLQLVSPVRLDFSLLSGFIYESPRERSLLWQTYAYRALALLAILFLMSLLWIGQLRKAVRLKTAAVIEKSQQAEQLAQEAREANAAKSMFIAGVSHEFRTPLTSIIGFSQLMMTSGLNAQQDKWTSIIRTRADDLLGLVNQVLDLVQLDRVPVPTDTGDFDISAEIDNVAESFTTIFAEKKISLQKSDQIPTKTRVHGSVHVVRQVLINLLSNASKFAPIGGQIILRLELTRSEKQLREYLLVVEDSGPGIPDGMKEMVFDPFTQVKDSYFKKNSGSGLGLTICRRLVESIGGRIWIEDAKPHGCAVHATFPFEPPKKAEAQSQNMKVLVVDDDGLNRELIRTYLSMDGFRITEADSGHMALKTCEEEEFDFILMDLGLPDIDGVQVAEKIQMAESSKNKRTPIAALTAAPLPRERERCIAAGMVAFMGKPVNFEALVQTIRGS